MFQIEWIVVDLCGPFFKTPNNNQFILVVVDVCTRFTFLRALPDKSAITVAQCLMVLITQFGTFKIISSDNDGAFVNSIISRLKEVWKIDQRTVSPYHPRANGLAERHVALAKQALKRIVEAMTENLSNQTEKFENWDEYLPTVELSLNIRMNNTNKTSPFELFFGRPFNGFQDFQNSEVQTLSEQQIHDRWKVLLEEVFPVVMRIRDQSQQHTDRSFERTHPVSESEIKPGTIVMRLVAGGYDNNKKRPAFLAPYEGPYIVMKTNRSGNYVLKEMSTGNQEELASPIDKLKVLGKVKPVKVIAEEKVGNEIQKCVLFSDKSQLWVASDADILGQLQNQSGVQELEERVSDAGQIEKQPDV